MAPATVLNQASRAWCGCIFALSSYLVITVIITWTTWTATLRRAGEGGGRSGSTGGPIGS
jgi:hypothetical protein